MARVALLGALFSSLVLASPSLAGDGTFPTEPAGSPFAADSSPLSVAIGDFNSDGNEDMAVANEDGGVTVRLGAGDGTFATEPSGSPFGTGITPVSVAVGDFNSDGHEDLAVANLGGGVTVRLGAGDGTFPTEPVGSPFGTGDDPSSVAVGDFNSDGNEDLAVTNFDSDDVTVRLGAGDGTFPTEPVGSPFSAGMGPVSVAIGDFNSDGDEDMAVVNSGAGIVFGDVTVRLGAGDGTFATEPPGSPYGPVQGAISIAIGDFNSDGNEDLAVLDNAAGVGPGKVVIRLGAGDGTFPTEPPGSPFGAELLPAEVVIGDFNSDGNEDLAVVNSNNNVTVRLGAGDGTFATEASGSPVGAGITPISLAIGDFNSDGNEDLAAGNQNGANVTIRLGGGAPPLQGNLLNNGGVEGAGAARTLGQSPALPSGWQRTGRMTYLRYGVAGDRPRHIASPRYLTGGLNLFYGGNLPGDSSATQTVSVASSAASIDAGLATTSLSAHLGGFRSENDRMSAMATFRSAGGAPLGSLTIGPLTSFDRNWLTVLQRRSTGGAVPAGTRQIEVRLDALYATGPRNDAMADNVKLTLSAPAPPAPPITPTAPVTSPPAPSTAPGVVCKKGQKLKNGRCVKKKRKKKRR